MSNTNPDRISNRIRQIMYLGENTPRVRHPNEALPPANDLWQRPVYDGAELRTAPPRGAASMVAYKIPSRGACT